MQLKIRASGTARCVYKPTLVRISRGSGRHCCHPPVLSSHLRLVNRSENFLRQLSKIYSTAQDSLGVLESVDSQNQALSLRHQGPATSKEQPDFEQLIELGSFSQPHGIKGELKFRAISDAIEERLSQPGCKWAWLKTRRKLPIHELEIEWFSPSIAKGQEIWLVKINGVDSIEEAENWQGYTLGMLASDRPQIDDGNEFYAQELIGMKVLMHVDKTVVGTVQDVYDGTGTHDLLRIKLEPGSQQDSSMAPETALVPFVQEIVPIVDRESKEIEIEPPAGLLDIPGLIRANSTNPNKKKRKKR